MKQHACCEAVVGVTFHGEVRPAPIVRVIHGNHAIMRELLPVVCLTTLILLGCEPPGTPPASETPNTATEQISNNPAPDSSEAVAAVEAAAGKVERDAAGFLVLADFRGKTVSNEVARHLPSLNRLQSLLLNEAQLEADVLQFVGECVGLRQLDLRDCSLANEDLVHLKNLTNLKALRLSGKTGATTVDDAGMAYLAPLKNLKVLLLDFLWVSGEGLSQLASLDGLEELYLAGTLVGDEDLKYLAQFPQLKKLRVSKLSQVSLAGLEEISKLAALQDLDLSENSSIFDDDVAPLARLTTLKRLNLWRVAITDRGVAHLEGLVNLEWLNLDNTQMTDAGVKSLGHMHKLRFLHLGSTALSDAGLPDLARLTSLRDLKVTRTAVTEAGVTELQKQLPETTIQLKYLESE